MNFFGLISFPHFGQIGIMILPVRLCKVISYMNVDRTLAAVVPLLEGYPSFSMEFCMNVIDSIQDLYEP